VPRACPWISTEFLYFRKTIIEHVFSERRKTMKKNLFIKVILLVIASLLAINLIVLFVSPSTTHAAGRIQYKVVAYVGYEDDAQQMESLLNTFANDGWELVTLEPVFGSFIFKK
jgi:hypothetical protein